MIALLLSLLAIAPQSPDCIWGRAAMPGGAPIDPGPSVRARSPKDSVSVQLGNAQVKVCYSRPSARGRTMIGGSAVPYGRVWRTGANEPTMIHTTAPLSIAGIRVEPGTYSLYTVPGEETWEIIVNRSYSQWGHENAYSDEVRAQEVGRARVPVGRTEEHVEQFTISARPGRGNTATLVLEWERTRVSVPLERPR